ncbi:MAG: FAD-dependent oxidoreductase [Nanoarchaeota archaeon]
MPAITLSNPASFFYLRDGKALKSISDLAIVLKTITDDSFAYHVTSEKNDFANWISDTFKEPQLATALRNARTKNQIREVLQRYLDKGHFVHETIIIGGGIAGMSAALYAARSRMDYLIISPDFGGQMNVSGEIENYPGMAHTNFAEFQDKFKEQMDVNGIVFTDETVTEIRKLPDGHFLVVTDAHRHETETVILCTGARARKLGVPGEAEFDKKGITYCHVCDGPLFKGRDVAIVGGGDAALEAAAGMLRIARKLYLITVNPKLIGKAYLLERVVGQENVTVIVNAKTTRILGNKSVTAIAVEQNGKEKILPVEGIIVEIGRVPNTEAAGKLCAIDSDGHIMVDRDQMTSVPGIFAAGDCADGHEYQYVISAGQAVTALLKAQKYLQQK